MHKEVSSRSKEVALAGQEELPVTINFRPSVVGLIDAVLRVRVVGTTMRHNVSFTMISI